MNPDQSNGRSKLIHAEISHSIIGAFYFVHNELGHGYLEPIYARALEIMLKERGHVVHREYPLVVRFRGEPIGFHRCDMIVDKRVIVEIKATELLSPAAKRQLRNYLSGMKLELGMLLHFGPKANYYRILGPRVSQSATTDPDISG